MTMMKTGSFWLKRAGRRKATTSSTKDTNRATHGHNKSTAPVARMQASHEKPCWEVAGISKSAIAERSRIEQETRSQVQSVCNDSSLNEQQKREKIREIRQQSHQQIDALISPQQQEALKACQKERAAARGGSAGHGAGGIHRGGGPCGEMTAPKPSEPERP